MRRIIFEVNGIELCKSLDAVVEDFRSKTA